MTTPPGRIVGTVVGLRRYPVKSMLGEELEVAELQDSGLAGDRAYALVDNLDGKVATAKNPRKWPTLFDFRATLTGTPPDAGSAPLSITLPDGAVLSNDAPGIDRALSTALGRDVTLTQAHARSHISEEYWPDMEELERRETVTDFTLPAGTFFDSAIVHVLTTATLERLKELYPEGRFDIARFRPNVVITPVQDRATFAEDAWIGHEIAIGPSVRLRIEGPCQRCVMTTLAQDDLPQDRGILRTAARHHAASVGIYASVVQRGQLRVGDDVTLVG